MFPITNKKTTDQSLASKGPNTVWPSTDMSLEVLESIDYANRTAVSSISTGQLEKFRKIREWVELRNLFAGEVRSMTYEYNTTHDGAVKNDISQHISAYEYAISDLENLIRSDLSAYKTLSMIRAKNGKAVER